MNYKKIRWFKDHLILFIYKLNYNLFFGFKNSGISREETEEDGACSFVFSSVPEGMLNGNEG